MRLERAVNGGVHDDFDLTNYSLEHVVVHLEIALESDFADLFDVKQHQLVERGRVDTHWEERRTALISRYRNKDFRRGLVYQIAYR